MNQEKYIKYLQQGKDPYREEFNSVAKTLDNYANKTNLPDEQRLYCIRNIIDSMLDRPHKPKVINTYGQQELGF